MQCRGRTSKSVLQLFRRVPGHQCPDGNSETKDVTNLKPDEIELQLAALGREDEVETWKDVFGIEKRYKAKLCGKNEGKAWVQKIAEEWDNCGLTREKLLAYPRRV